MYQLVLVLSTTWLPNSRQLDGLVESLARAKRKADSGLSGVICGANKIQMAAARRDFSALAKYLDEWPQCGFTYLQIKSWESNLPLLESQFSLTGCFTGKIGFKPAKKLVRHEKTPFFLLLLFSFCLLNLWMRAQEQDTRGWNVLSIPFPLRPGNCHLVFVPSSHGEGHTKN